MHRKKDAKDWGVEPQIVVPMDETAEKRVLEDHYTRELYHRPITVATTRPSTQPATGPSTGPTTNDSASGAPATGPTQPVDPQLEAAVSTMIGHIILTGVHNEGESIATTQPAPPPQ